MVSNSQHSRSEMVTTPRSREFQSAGISLNWNYGVIQFTRNLHVKIGTQRKRRLHIQSVVPLNSDQYFFGSSLKMWNEPLVRLGRRLALVDLTCLLAAMATVVIFLEGQVTLCCCHCSSCRQHWTSRVGF